MAKGQQRSNREIRKPKKSAAQKNVAAAPATVSAVLGKPAKNGAKK